MRPSLDLPRFKKVALPHTGPRPGGIGTKSGSKERNSRAGSRDGVAANLPLQFCSPVDHDGKTVRKYSPC
jgi:hypothetical protein